MTQIIAAAIGSRYYFKSILIYYGGINYIRKKTIGMRPLILEYAEVAKNDELESGIIKYSKIQNLNIIIESDEPAINTVHFDTDTFTKSNMEGSDSDRDFRMQGSLGLDTQLITRSINETTGDDDIRNFTKSYLDTQIVTEAREGTSFDK